MSACSCASVAGLPPCHSLATSAADAAAASGLLGSAGRAVDDRSAPGRTNERERKRNRSACDVRQIVRPHRRDGRRAARRRRRRQPPTGDSARARASPAPSTCRAMSACRRSRTALGSATPATVDRRPAISAMKSSSTGVTQSFGHRCSQLRRSDAEAVTVVAIEDAALRWRRATAGRDADQTDEPPRRGRRSAAALMIRLDPERGQAASASGRSDAAAPAAPDSGCATNRIRSKSCGVHALQACHKPVCSANRTSTGPSAATVELLRLRTDTQGFGMNSCS